MLCHESRYLPPRGFSLLELMLVITILGFIATLLVPRMSDHARNARENVCFHNKALINAAAEMFQLETGSFPTDISDLDTPDRFPDGIPDCPVAEAPYVLDGTTHRVIGHLGGGKTGGHP